MMQTKIIYLVHSTDPSLWPPNYLVLKNGGAWIIFVFRDQIVAEI